MQLNPAFITNIHSLYGKSGKTWLKELPIQLKRLSTKWNLRFIKPMSYLSYHFVSIIEQLNSGEHAVIKIAVEDAWIANKVRWLISFTQAVPQIYHYDATECALLMEYIRPGHALTALVDAGDDGGATRYICRLIKNLQSHQQKQAQFKHLSEFIIHLKTLKGQIDKKLFQYHAAIPEMALNVAHAIDKLQR